jgi:DNA-binding NtrC family response regulator
MIRILIAGRGTASLSALKSALDESDTQITHMDSGRKALSVISEKEFDLLIADEKLADMTGIELIESVISKRPMLDCAMISSLSSDDFHEATEGLGILMQLPVQPGKQEAEQLLGHLQKIHSFSNTKGELRL